MDENTTSSLWKELPLVLVHPETRSFNDLPRDLLTNILSRLPVKTLIRSTSVSRNWYSLIKNPSFIKTHLTRSISKLSPTDHYILITPKSPSGEPILSLFSDEESCNFEYKVKIPFETWSKSVRIVGSCNGLICMTDNHESLFGGDVYLFNPAVRKVRVLKAEFSCYCDWMQKNWQTYPVLGFGFCEQENDFRVVRIVYSAHRISAKLRPRVEVYSLRSAKWRSVKAKVDHTIFRGCSAFVDGYLYWIAAERADERISWVMWFDLKEEVFREVEMPKDYDKGSLDNNLPVNIMRWNDEVAVCAIDRYKNCVKCGFWVLKKDGGGEILWKKQLELLLMNQLCGMPVGFTQSGKVAVDNDPSRRNKTPGLTKIVALNTEDMKCKNLAVDGLHTADACFQESLVLFLAKYRITMIIGYANAWKIWTWF